MSGKETMLSTINFQKRVKSALIMMFGFIAFISGGKIGLYVLGTAVNIMMYKEIITIARKKYLKNGITTFNNLHWLFFGIAFFYHAGRIFFQEMIGFKILNESHLKFVRIHKSLTYLLLVIAVVTFVLHLKSGCYRNQFKILGICLATLFFVNSQIFLLFKLNNSGSIWVIFPITIICINDGMAYMVGKMYGKTKLTMLSPRKTAEGFVGGAVSTVFLSFFVSNGLTKFKSLLCPTQGFIHVDNCLPPLMYTQIPYTISLEFLGAISRFFRIQTITLNISEFQMHGFYMSVMISIIGPFGGFFASGYKRAFKIKDFGDMIPGHGGLTDRLDCLPLVSILVYMYKNTFAYTYESDQHYLFSLFLKLSEEDQTGFYDQIRSYMQNN